QDYFYEKNYDISIFTIESSIDANTTWNNYDFTDPPKSLNYSNLFGKILEKEIYDEEQNLIEKDIYTYDFSEKSEKIYLLQGPTTTGTKLNTVFIGDLLIKSYNNIMNYDNGVDLESIE